MIAFVRPDAWDLPLFVHVLGAMLLVSFVAVAVAALAAPRAVSAGDALLARAGAWSLGAAVPAYVVMRAGAEWAREREGFPAGARWIDVGYRIADGGAAVLVAAAVLAWIGARRRSAAATRVAAALAALLVAAYVVAVWVMTTKPS